MQYFQRKPRPLILITAYFSDFSVTLYFYPYTDLLFDIISASQFPISGLLVTSLSAVIHSCPPPAISIWPDHPFRKSFHYFRVIASDS